MKLYERLSGKEVYVNETKNYPDYSNNYLFYIPLSHYFVRNLRDLPIMHMILNNLIFVFLFIPCIWYYQSHVYGFLYLLVNYSIFFGRFMCLNHEFTHTQIFKVKWVGNVLTMFVLGHSHGLPFGSYYINHVIMHHKGSNAWGVDFSSTEKYNRESLWHFLHYWLRHYTLFSFVYDCVYVCVMYGRIKIAVGYALVSLIWVSTGLYLYLCTDYAIAALYTMLLPLFITGLFGAVGGWMQHFFVHPNKPSKWYSYDIINSYANTHGFNQGFHQTHHTLGNLHWTELPHGFETLLRDYDADDVMIIQTLENVQVFLLVMSKRYETLARYLVTTKPGGHSLNDCVQYTQQHLRPVLHN